MKIGIMLVIIGYFLANILDSFAESYLGEPSIPSLDYVFFAVLVGLLFINRRYILGYIGLSKKGRK